MAKLFDFLRLRAFMDCRRGVFAVIAAVMLPVMVLAVGLGADYVLLWSEITRAKQAADFAALAGARAGREYLGQPSAAEASAKRVANEAVISNRA